MRGESQQTRAKWKTERHSHRGKEFLIRPNKFRTMLAPGGSGAFVLYKGGLWAVPVIYGRGKVQ